jgi:hypothetical protein
MLDRSSYWRMKLYALQKISKSSNPKCVYCGCDFLRVLEINHKNCNKRELERKFRKPESGYSFYKRIVNGTRTTEDLEVVCGVCNKNHYFQRKFGLRWQVVYEYQRNKQKI